MIGIRLFLWKSLKTVFRLSKDEHENENENENER